MPLHTPQLSLFPEFTSGNSSHPLLQSALLRDLVRDGMPELLDGSSASLALHEEIYQYLFTHKRLRDRHLESAVTPFLYDLLYGLKLQLKHADLPTVERAMEERKRRFLDFMHEELYGDEEE